MTVRSLTKKLGNVLFAAEIRNSLMTGNALAKEEAIVWRVVTSWPPKFPLLQDGTERLAQNIEKMTGGRLKMQVFAGGEVVAPLEVFDAVSQGKVAQAGSTAPYFYPQKTPDAQFFSDYPFGMTHRGKMAWLYCGGGMELFREIYKPHQLYPFIMLSTGTQMGGWFRKEIKSKDDLNGLKMRIPGLAGKVMAKAGVNVINLPGSEIPSAMESGTLDAAEWVSPLYDISLGLHKSAKYYYYPAWHEPATTVVFVVNLKTWEALPEDLKLCVEMACAESTSWTLAKADVQNPPILKEMVEKLGVQLKKFPDDVIRELRRLTSEVMDAEASANPALKKVYESLKKFQADFNYWMESSEWAYIDGIRL